MRKNFSESLYSLESSLYLYTKQVNYRANMRTLKKKKYFYK